MSRAAQGSSVSADPLPPALRKTECRVGEPAATALGGSGRLPKQSDVTEIAPREALAEAGEAPVVTRRAKARLRDSDLFLLVLALGAGTAAGTGVVLIDLLLKALRWLAYGIPRSDHLSDIDLGPARVLMMPVLGGLLVGLSAALLRRWRRREVVDAIE